MAVPYPSMDINEDTGMIGGTNDFPKPVMRDGLDAIYFIEPMNGQLAQIEANMKEIMDANLSDVQKQFRLQQLMNSWSAISQGMTNMLKAVADVNKAVVRNIE
jgi:hypothetical protein